MSETAGTPPPMPSAVREQPRQWVFPDQRPRLLRRLGGLSLALASAATVGLAFLPAPYVVETPGPTFDTLGETDEGPLITVADAETYPTEGELRLLTVQQRGNPERPLSWFDIASAYIDPSDSIVPMEVAFQPNQTVEQSNEAGQIEMKNSQSAAIAAALLHEGLDVKSDVTIASVVPGSPAEKLLREGDRITAVNDEKPFDVYSIRASIAAKEGESAFEIERDGVTSTVRVLPTERDGQKLVGIVPQNEFTFPIDVTIQLPNVGGPSAGLMFAIAIVDEITPGALTGGKNWAGTGTISAEGEVGPIGGVVQKMHGAVEAGATEFLVPTVNCPEVVGAEPSGLNVYAVATLDEAVTAVETVAAGGDTAALPTCASVAAGLPSGP